MESVRHFRDEVQCLSHFHDRVGIDVEYKYTNLSFRIVYMWYIWLQQSKSTETGNRQKFNSPADIFFRSIAFQFLFFST